MNRIEELELTVQMLIDSINHDTPEEFKLDYDEAKVTLAESILASRPCSCAELPFPHKRSRACFLRYSR